MLLLSKIQSNGITLNHFTIRSVRRILLTYPSLLPEINMIHNLLNFWKAHFKN